MKLLKGMLLLLTLLGLSLLLWTKPSTATPKYAKETGKKCLECHKKSPKKGEDPQLTELGKKFLENGHKLPN
jgi:hypothetical protein